MTIHHYIRFLLVCAGTIACTHPSPSSSTEQKRKDKQQQDSIAYHHALQNVHYSDSLLQQLLPRVDEVMREFVYSRNEKAEDHGHYVHRLLQTTSNTSRNFLQAYVSDDRQTSLQSYYYGGKPQHQKAVRVSVDENYLEKEGSNHVFQAEGWHEILTIQGQDAISLLSYIETHAGERIRVQSIGDNAVTYYLSEQEKKALAATYRLSVYMREIEALERAIRTSDLQIQKYEKKQANKH